jgi:MraZ protein
MEDEPFISTFTVTLDAKGRVCIPAPYRQILVQKGAGGVYVCPSFSSEALECFGRDFARQFHNAEASYKNLFSRKKAARVMAILAQTQNLGFDENGRVRLPDDLIKHAGLKDRVVFVGMGDRFQIWEPARFEAMRAEMLKQVMAEMDADDDAADDAGEAGEAGAP